MSKREYKPKANPVTSSFFGEYAHRWPEAGGAVAYAMACVEVVANCSPDDGDLYRGLVKAWAAPGVKGFYEQFVANVPEEEVEEWKDKLRNTGLALLPDPNKPFEDLVGLGSSLESVVGSEEVVNALQGVESTPETTDAAILFDLMFDSSSQGLTGRRTSNGELCASCPRPSLPGCCSWCCTGLDWSTAG